MSRPTRTRDGCCASAPRPRARRALPLVLVARLALDLVLAADDRAGAAGARDAEQAAQAGQAVAVGAVDAEVRLRLAGAVQLGPDAGVVGAEGAVGKAGPEVAHIVVEAAGARRVDVVVLHLDEL